jgi:hypothetical protein
MHGRRRYVLEILVGKPKGKISFERLQQTDLKERGNEDVQ